MNIIPHILNILSSAVLVIVTYKINKALKAKDEAIKEAESQSRAVAEGVESLLRISIISDYNKYQDKGYCPVYAKENLKAEYEAYHNLGGNDVATELYNELLKMPTEAQQVN